MNTFVVLTSAFATIIAYNLIFKRASKRNLPTLYPGYPIVGSFFDVIKYGGSNRFHVLLDKMTSFGRVVHFKIINQSLFVTNKAELVKSILSSANFERDDFFQSNLVGISKYSLFLIPSGDIWKKHRKLLQPGFGPGFLKYGSKVSNDVSKQLFVDSWGAMPLEKQAKVDLYRHLHLLTVDVIGKVSFSYDFGLTKDFKSETDEKYKILKLISDISYVIGKRFTYPPWLWSFAGISVSHMIEKMSYITEKLHDVIESKKLELDGRKPSEIKPEISLDALDRMIESSMKEDGAFNNEELKDEVFGFFLAGHETSSNTMAFIVIEILKHPEVLRKLRVEVENVLNGREDFVYEDLANLKYTECIIKETLRLSSTVGLLQKRCVKETELDGFHVAKDTVVMLNLNSIHRHPDYWSEPDVFQPERWENGFVPIADGPMNCIGQKLAMLEMKIVIASLFHHVDLEIIPGQDLEPITALTRCLKNELFVKISHRK